jgi:hypothetical protein
MCATARDCGPEVVGMIGPVVELLYGQGVDQPRGGPGVARRLDVAELADAEALRRWLAGSPPERLVVQVLPCAGRFLVLFRDEEAGGRGR